MQMFPCRRSLASTCAVLIALMIWVMAIAPMVQAGSPPEVIKLAAHDAQNLAARIQAAARRRGSTAMTSVKVITGCCGVRALEVFERARPGSVPRYGVYYLGLVTKPGGRIEKITLSEDTTKRGYRLGAATDGPEYSFGLGPGHGNWSIVVGHAHHHDDRYTTEKVAYHYEEAQLTAEGLQALYAQALAVLTKAERHAPVSEEVYLHPGLPCGLPEHQACEPGGRW